MFSFFGRRGASPNRQLLERLHADIVAAARQPGFYLDYGVADTFEGRFELLTLHAALLLGKLHAAESPGPEVAQDLVDVVFRHLDSGLRELGVGDMAVPKRMKRLAEAFLGRAAAYHSALRQGNDTLAPVLSRNIFDGGNDGRKLARYVEEAHRTLTRTPLDSCLRRPLPFPDLRAEPW